MIKIRPVTTRYETPQSRAVNVATPSCCCCCCCLGTVSAAIAFSARSSWTERHNNDASAFAPWLAGLALPIAVALAILFTAYVADEILGVTSMALIVPIFVLLFMASQALAGSVNWAKSLAVSACLLVVGAGVMVAEFFAVIVTAGIAWLALVPLGIWFGLKVADSIYPSKFYKSPGKQIEFPKAQPEVPPSSPPYQDPFS